MIKQRYLPVFAALLFFAVTGCEVVTEAEPGPPGPPGNANVFSLNFLFTMDEADVNGSVASVQYDVPALTPSVVDDGAVLMFFREQGTWTAMPYTFAVESPDLAAVDYTISLGFGYDDEFVEVFYEASTDAIDLDEQPDREMKLVVIDGYGAGKASTAGIDLTDYEAVKAHFGLAD